MISSNAFRFLAVAGLGLGALAAPAEAAVFQASATVVSLDSFFEPLIFLPFSLPQYSGPGTIVGVNIALSGSASGTDTYAYMPDIGITVPSYINTWEFTLSGPPNPSGGSFLEVDVPAEYVGGSVPPCPTGGCGGFPGNEFPAFAGPMAFSGNVDVSDFSDFAGSASNAFELIVDRNPNPPQPGELLTPDLQTLIGSMTVTETIMTVPEPSTWAMALIGFAIVGFAARGRVFAGVRRRAAAVQRQA